MHYRVFAMRPDHLLRNCFVLALCSLSPDSATYAQTTSELQPDSAKHANAPETWPQQAVRGAHAMVATDESLGSQAVV
jgi:hypothetical protein